MPSWLSAKLLQTHRYLGDKQQTASWCGGNLTPLLYSQPGDHPNFLLGEWRNISGLHQLSLSCYHKWLSPQLDICMCVFLEGYVLTPYFFLIQKRGLNRARIKFIAFRLISSLSVYTLLPESSSGSQGLSLKWWAVSGAWWGSLWP